MAPAAGDFTSQLCEIDNVLTSLQPTLQYDHPSRGTNLTLVCENDKLDAHPLQNASKSSSKNSPESTAGLKTPAAINCSMKNGFLGGVMANLLKLFIRAKFQSCGKLDVTIGGSTLQLLTGHTTGFHIHIRDFIFEGCSVSEAEAQSEIKSWNGEVRFNLNAARHGGKLFSQRVKTKMAMRLNESNANYSLQRKEGNVLLRENLAYFWKLRCSGGNRGSGQCGDAEMPAFTVLFQSGYALYDEIVEEGEEKLPMKIALKFNIEKEEGRSILAIKECSWKDYCLPAESMRSPAKKVFDLPPDIFFLSFIVDNGWMTFSYTFEFDL